jgi:hypothetical protein
MEDDDRPRLAAHQGVKVNLDPMFAGLLPRSGPDEGRALVFQGWRSRGNNLKTISAYDMAVSDAITAVQAPRIARTPAGHARLRTELNLNGTDVARRHDGFSRSQTRWPRNYQARMKVMAGWASIQTRPRDEDSQIIIVFAA